MKTFWLITILILWMGFKAYRKGVRRTAAHPEDSAEGTQQPTAYPRPSFESLFEEDDEEKDEEAPSYFSYETLEEEERQQQPVAAVRETRPQEPVVAAVEEPVETPAFDLRQAVIYQTILNNKYNPEMSHS